MRIKQRVAVFEGNNFDNMMVTKCVLVYQRYDTNFEFRYEISLVGRKEVMDHSRTPQAVIEPADSSLLVQQDGPCRGRN